MESDKEIKFPLLLKKARLKHQFTQEKAAEHLGISPRTLRDWESGSSIPRLGVQRRIADLFNISLNELGLVNTDITVESASGEVLSFEVKERQNYIQKGDQNDRRVDPAVGKHIATYVQLHENSLTDIQLTTEATSAASIQELINLLTTSGVRLEEARLKGYESAFQLATELIRLSPQEQSLPAHAILHSAMRIYRMAIETDNPKKG